MRRMPGSVYTLSVPAILSSQVLNTKNQKNVYFGCADFCTDQYEIIFSDYICKSSFASRFFAVDMMFLSASSIKGKSTLLLREAARRFIFRSATVCGRSISRWLKAEKVRYEEKELSNKRRLLLKIYRFHKSLSIYILLS